MSQSLQNIVLIAIVVILVAGGYYVFFSDSVTDTDSASQAELLAKTQSFISRSNQLKQINIDQTFFTNPNFVSLHSFSSDVPDQPVGRDDIFSEAKTLNSVKAAKVE